MSADDLARALEDLKVQLSRARGLVGSESSRVEGTKRKVDSIVGSANGVGTIQLLRAAATEYRKASEQVCVAHDALGIATDALQRYLSANFRQIGGGSAAGGGNGQAAEWSAISPIGFVHTALSTRAQKRAIIKNALFVGAKASFSALKVGAVAGTLVGALVAGTPLIAAVGIAAVVSVGLDGPALAATIYKHVHELGVQWDRGSITRDEIKAQILSRIAKEGLEYGIGKIPVIGEPFGVVMDVKTLVELIEDLRKVPQ